jgi:arginine deiminase
MLNVTSEIGTLRRVVVHTPGQEVRRMTPALRHELLFDDILYLDLARHEHEAFKRIHSAIVPPADVLDSADMLRDVLQDESVRHELVESVCRLERGPESDVEDLRRDLQDAHPDELASWLIEGMPDPGRDAELTAYLSDMPYQITPIPNLMFMRDPCAVIGNGLMVGHMTFRARKRESLLVR